MSVLSVLFRVCRYGERDENFMSSASLEELVKTPSYGSHAPMQGQESRTSSMQSFLIHVILCATALDMNALSNKITGEISSTLFSLDITVSRVS